MLRRCVLLACSLLGCPSTRDGGGGAPHPPTQSGDAQLPMPAAAVGPAPASVPGATTTTAEEAKVVPLAAGEPVAPDPASDGETFGVELLFEVRLRALPAPPVQLGAVAAAVASLQNARAGSLRVALAAGRARLRVGPSTFALDEGWELRLARSRGGALLILPSSSYRVVPTGALRALLSERRLDVVPLGPTHLGAATAGSHLGRTTRRTKISTAHGSMELDQVVAPPSPRTAPKQASTDAGKPDGALEPGEPGVDGGGEPLCRALLELIAADRALGGSPCEESLVPVRADVAFAAGGGVVLEATSLREGSIPLSDLAFPPPGAKHVTTALGEPASKLPAPELLATLRAKGDVATLELSNKSPLARVIVLDGVPLGVVPAGADRPLTLRVGKYVVEWRTPLGEILERAVEVDCPGRATTAQWVPSPLSSASPIASARNGP